MKNILAVLAFYVKLPGWHSFNSKNRATVRAVKSLEKLGYLELNKFSQARHTGKIFAE